MDCLSKLFDDIVAESSVSSAPGSSEKQQLGRRLIKELGDLVLNITVAHDYLSLYLVIGRAFFRDAKERLAKKMELLMDGRHEFSFFAIDTACIDDEEEHQGTSPLSRVGNGRLLDGSATSATSSRANDITHEKPYSLLSCIRAHGALNTGKRRDAEIRFANEPMIYILGDEAATKSVAQSRSLSLKEILAGLQDHRLF
jgi:hypothetical protein